MKQFIGLLVLVIFMSTGASFGYAIPDDTKIEKTFTMDSIDAESALFVMDFPCVTVLKIADVDVGFYSLAMESFSIKLNIETNSFLTEHRIRAGDSCYNKNEMLPKTDNRDILKSPGWC